MELRDEDLKVDVFRNAPSGMSVAMQKSHVRITHLPTGMVAESDSERSQFANRQACIEKLKRMLEDSDNG